MLYNRRSVQDNIRNRDKQRVFYLGKGDQLTSDARDWLTAQRIPILPAEAAKPERYRLLTGGYCEEKPEHMTHLNGDVLVPKTHPRIAFRGKIDCLQAELLLCIRKANSPHKENLKQALELTRQILSHEVLDEPMEQLQLGGLTDEQLRTHSHRPQDFYGQPHFMPIGDESELLLLVNRARTLARQAELQAVAVFLKEEGLQRQDIIQNLNRLSSFLYLIMIQLKKEG